MPNIKSAKKRVKVNDANALENKKIKKMYREAVKAFELAVSNNESNTDELLKTAISSVDKAWSKGVIKKNTADRKKANMTKKASK